MKKTDFSIRNARPVEYETIGKLMVEVYSHLDGFPKPDEQPAYYNLLANVGELTKKPCVEILVATTTTSDIVGAVVYFGDMQYYGSGGSAIHEKNAAGFRLLAVSSSARNLGIGKALTQACIEKAEYQNVKNLVIHTTKAMTRAWAMYERMGFKRAQDMDFNQGELPVYGFRYNFFQSI